MKIKFEINGKEQIRDIPNEVIEKELETQKIIIKEKEERENALIEVNTAFGIIEEQLNELKKNINILNKDIQEKKEKLETPI